MNRKLTIPFYPILTLYLSMTFGAFAETPQPAPAPNGIEMPKNYRNWQLIGVAHRTDNHSLRAILGNPIAVKAARSGC